VRGMRAGRPLRSSGADGAAQVVERTPPVGPPERVLDGDRPVRLAERSQLDRRVELLPVGEEDRARVAVELDAVPVRDARNVEVRGQTYDRSAFELEDCDAEVGRLRDEALAAQRREPPQACIEAELGKVTGTRAPP
jgi:hypothetical protein